jgi:hypothetical protein
MPSEDLIPRIPTGSRSGFSEYRWHQLNDISAEGGITVEELGKKLLTIHDPTKNPTLAALLKEQKKQVEDEDTEMNFVFKHEESKFDI